MHKRSCFWKLFGSERVNVSWFLWCIRYSLECLTLHKNRQAIQTHHSTLELLFWVYCYYTALLYISRCNKWTSFEEQHVYSNFLNLSSVISKEQIYVVHWFYYFPCSWISFPCLYLDNNCLASFFIVCSVKVLYVLW